MTLEDLPEQHRDAARKQLERGGQDSSRKRRKKGPNQNELDYYARLMAIKATHPGVIESVAFEATTFDLAYQCTYTPDYDVMADKQEHHEVKGGHCWEDSWIKFKVAARNNPERRFVWAQRDGCGNPWTFKIFEGGKPVGKTTRTVEFDGQ